jgi:hypothetical protein
MARKGHIDDGVLAAHGRAVPKTNRDAAAMAMTSAAMSKR